MTMYLAFMRKSFMKRTTYRSEIWLRLGIGLAWMGIQVAIWSALIGSGEVAGITLPNMVTYAVLNTVLALTLVEQSLPEVDQKIRSGDIAVELIKPFSYLMTVFADQMGRSLYIAAFNVVPMVALAALFYGVQPPDSIANALAFLFSIGISLAISFAFASLIIMLAFYFLATFHFVWTFGAMKSLFAGSLVPFWFYPDGLRTVAEWLPFQFLGFFPAATWMGEFEGGELVRQLGLGVAWAVLLLAFAAWLWGRITRRLVVQGG